MKNYNLGLAMFGICVTGYCNISRALVSYHPCQKRSRSQRCLPLLVSCHSYGIIKFWTNGNFLGHDYYTTILLKSYGFTILYPLVIIVNWLVLSNFGPVGSPSRRRPSKSRTMSTRSTKQRPWISSHFTKGYTSGERMIFVARLEERSVQKSKIQSYPILRYPKIMWVCIFLGVTIIYYLSLWIQILPEKALN